MAETIGQGWLLSGDVKSSPLVSIITVVRRDPDGLLRTLRSVRALGLNSYEQIVIEADHAPCLDKDDVLEASGGESGLGWLVEPDSGVYDGMNRGLVAARGQWIWFLNAGDTVAPDLVAHELENMLVRAASEQATWIVGDARIIGPSGDVDRVKRSGDYSDSALRRGTYTPCHQAVLARRTEMARLGGFDCRLRLASDYRSFLLLAVRRSPLTTPIVLANYSAGGVSDRLRSRLRVEQAIARIGTIPRSRRENLLDLGKALAWGLRHQVEAKRS